MRSAFPMRVLAERSDTPAAIDRDHSHGLAKCVPACVKLGPCPPDDCNNNSNNSSNRGSASDEEYSGILVSLSVSPVGEEEETAICEAVTAVGVDGTAAPFPCAVEECSANAFPNFLREASAEVGLGSCRSNGSFENSMNDYQSDVHAAYAASPPIAITNTAAPSAMVRPAGAREAMGQDTEDASYSPQDYIPIDYDAEMADCSQYVFSARPYCPVVSRSCSGRCRSGRYDALQDEVFVTSGMQYAVAGSAPTETVTTSIYDVSGDYIPMDCDACLEGLDALCTCGSAADAHADRTTACYFTGEDAGPSYDGDEMEMDGLDEAGPGVDCHPFCSPISPSYSSPPVGHTPMANFPATFGARATTPPLCVEEPFSPAWLRRQRQLHSCDMMKESRLMHARMQEQQNFCRSSPEYLDFSIKCFLNEASRQDLRRLAALPEEFFTNGANVQRLLNTQVFSSLPATMRGLLLTSTTLSRDGDGAHTKAAAEKKAAVLAEVRAQWRALADRVVQQLENPHILYRDVITNVNALSLFTHNLPDRAVAGRGAVDAGGEAAPTALDGGRTQYSNLTPAYTFTVSGSSMVRQMDFSATDELRRRRLDRQAALLAQLQSEGSLFVLPTLYAEEVAAAVPVVAAAAPTTEACDDGEEESALVLIGDSALASLTTSTSPAMLLLTSPSRESLARPHSALSISASLSCTSSICRTPASGRGSTRASMSPTTFLSAPLCVVSGATFPTSIYSPTITSAARMDAFVAGVVARPRLAAPTHETATRAAVRVGGYSEQTEEEAGSESDSSDGWEEVVPECLYDPTTVGAEDGQGNEEELSVSGSAGVSPRPVTVKPACASASTVGRGLYEPSLFQARALRVGGDGAMLHGEGHSERAHGDAGRSGSTGGLLPFSDMDLNSASRPHPCAARPVVSGAVAAPLSSRRPSIRAAPQQLSAIFASSSVVVPMVGCAASASASSPPHSIGTASTMDSPSGISACESGGSSPNTYDVAVGLPLAACPAGAHRPCASSLSAVEAAVVGLGVDVVCPRPPHSLPS